MLARAVRARSMLRGLSTIAACTCNRHTQNSMLQYFNEVRLLRFKGVTSVMQTQRFFSRKNGDSEDDMMAEGEPELLLPDRDSQLPATVAVPDVWPHVPMLAMRRNPLFPRFMKIVEVGDVLHLALLAFYRIYSTFTFLGFQSNHYGLVTSQTEAQSALCWCLS